MQLGELKTYALKNGLITINGKKTSLAKYAELVYFLTKLECSQKGAPSSGTQSSSRILKTAILDEIKRLNVLITDIQEKLSQNEAKSTPPRVIYMNNVYFKETHIADL